MLLGEIKGKDIIDIGDVVNVELTNGGECGGRLNKASKKEITVGTTKIKVEEIVKISKEYEDKQVNSLFNWLEEGTYQTEIYATLEWLSNEGMLNKKGEDFAHKVYKHVWEYRKTYYEN